MFSPTIPAEINLHPFSLQVLIIMKKLFSFVAFSALCLTLSAQSMPKRYVLLEHFTNSRCGICAGKNPAFYTLIDQYPNEVRHLSIHPSVPYSDCKIYLANPTQNNARTSAYGVNGTPRVALNGSLVPVSTPLLSAATLQAAFGQESPIAIEVQEGGTAPNKTTSVTVRMVGDPPAGPHKLFVAVAESTVNYASPNGETKHYDVFRAMLTDINGDPITLPAKGASATYNFSYTHTQPSGWTSNYDSLYVLAFVQHAQTGAVLNTGTRFDPIFTSTNETSTIQPVLIRPNPVTEEASILLPDEEVLQVEIFSVEGQLVQTDYSIKTDQILRMPVSRLVPGIYWVRVTGKNRLYTGKFVKH
ncbi:MAG: Omp28-related outer membrane protein [Saprospiraceae bacterium]|nr:Omp28-related outer membrane protein [Saprospiraceae bacterium]